MRVPVSILLIAALAGCAVPPRAAPQALPRGVERLDYGPWDRLLRRHVRGGRVDYAGIDRDPDFTRASAQVENAALSPDTPRADRLAFWINAYNTRAVAGILDGGSPATLFGRYQYFLRTRHPVAGEAITLYDLENERIRPLGEPRIHFAIVCASASCPALAARAYHPATLDAQLERATVAFVNDSSRNRFDSQSQVAYLSRIFKWYAGDFEQESGSVQRYLARYVADEAVARALAQDGYEVEYLDYDWSLNGSSP